MVALCKSDVTQITIHNLNSSEIYYVALLFYFSDFASESLLNLTSVVSQLSVP